MHRRDMEKVAVKCLLELEAMGVRVDVISDPSKVANAISSLKSSTGAAYDDKRLLLTQTNTFWIVASREDQPVLAFGVRVDDLGQEDAQSFLSRSIEVIFGVKVSGVSHSIFQGKKWGRAAYFGGFQSTLAKGLSRDGSKVMQLLAGYAHHCAFVDLRSDVNYSFHRMSHGGRGLPYGFNHVDPFVWRTDRPMYPDGDPGWVMQLRSEDLPSVLAHCERLFSHRLTKDGEDFFPIEVNGSTGGQ